MYICRENKTKTPISRVALSALHRASSSRKWPHDWQKALHRKLVFFFIFSLYTPAPGLQLRFIYVYIFTGIESTCPVTKPVGTTQINSSTEGSTDSESPPREFLHSPPTQDPLVERMLQMGPETARRRGQCTLPYLATQQNVPHAKFARQIILH